MLSLSVDLSRDLAALGFAYPRDLSLDAGHPKLAVVRGQPYGDGQDWEIIPSDVWEHKIQAGLEDRGWNIARTEEHHHATSHVTCDEHTEGNERKGRRTEGGEGRLRSFGRVRVRSKPLTMLDVQGQSVHVSEHATSGYCEIISRAMGWQETR